MTETRVQELVASLKTALGLTVTCGSITLNLNDDRLCSVKTETHLRIVRNPLDRRPELRNTHG